MKESYLSRVLISGVLILAALISFFLIGNKVSAPETYQKTIASINGKVETVLLFTASSTVVSAGISAIPNDTATPIAEKFADFSEYFLIVLCVLYAEKYLLTIIGAAVFRILIPAACVILIVSLFRNPKALHRLGAKLIVVGLCFFITIPTGVRVSDMIYDTYQISLGDTVAAAEELREDTSELADAKNDAGLVQSVLQRLSESVTSLAERAANLLNRFVESLAVIIVTSCIIPLLVLAFFLWLIKIVTGASLPIQMPRRFRKTGKMLRPERDDSTSLTV